MIEYLYIDIPRLGRYYEQISLPVVYDKVPVWKVALGISGPKVEGTQSRTGRAPTNHEKIQKFLEYIDERKLVSCERPYFSDNEDEKPFIFEYVCARRAVIRKNDLTLSIWVALGSEQQ
jgi:hypothetical protein